MRDIWNEILQWTKEGKSFALARVVQTWGSAPRAVGAAMIVGRDLEVAGSVSGGCIEGAVIEEALKVLDSGQPKKLRYGVEDEKAWSVGLSCGGQVEVLVEPHWAQSREESTRAVWQALKKAVEKAEPAVLLTWMEGGEAPHLLAYPGGRVEGDWGARTPGAVALAQAAYGRRQNEIAELAGGQVFVQVFARQDQLLIVGAGHLALLLVHFARELEFSTVVIDPRRVFADEKRFPTPPDELIARWPAEALKKRRLDEDTYALLLTHDPKIDDEALHILLKTPVRYLGALGSRKTHARRCERLRQAGFSEEQIDRIRGPAGLEIGAQSPGEIALSMLAEVVAARRQR
jgi:xanthine dehydrogenase accessory factor